MASAKPLSSSVPWRARDGLRWSTGSAIPRAAAPGLVLINPLRSVDDIAEALSTAQPADDLTMVPIQLDEDPPTRAHPSLVEPLVEPPAPLDRPLPTLARSRCISKKMSPSMT